MGELCSKIDELFTLSKALSLTNAGIRLGLGAAATGGHPAICGKDCGEEAGHESNQTPK